MKHIRCNKTPPVTNVSLFTPYIQDIHRITAPVWLMSDIGGREIECIMQKGNNIYSIETNGSVRGLSTMMVTTMSPWRVSGLTFTRQLEPTSTWSVPCGDISWRWGLVFIELD